ncbi:MAG TPA: SRPBCC domain-containing protein [Flavobacteriales bacterium]|nr:SRPBCC domain-containing protein [Flavobacteriales bacterium]
MIKGKETTVERRVRIDAPVQAVWDVLNKDGLSRLHLLREEGEPKLKEGARVAWHHPEEPQSPPRVIGRITVVSKPRRIALMLYMPGAGLPDEPENYTLTEITLIPEEDGRTLVVAEQGDFAKHPHGPRLAKQAGDRWVEALIRLKDTVEHQQAA